MKINRADYRSSRVTRAIEGDADPNANMGHCVNCGHWDLLSKRNMCYDAACRRSRAQRALNQGAGMVIDGNVYIVTEHLRDAPQAWLPEHKAANNAARQRELDEVSRMTQRDIKDLNGKLARNQIQQIESNMTTEDAVPECKECQSDGCTDCPRPSDVFCVKHRLEANALEYRLNPPQYRQSQSTDTELPSRKRSRGKQRYGKIRGYDRVRRVK